MLPTAEHIRQAGCGSGFPGAGGHDQQVLPEALTNLLTYSPDCLFLVIPVRDLIVN